jgi:hypothetical protein
MSDTLVYDMSMTQEASPSIFVKKDMLTLMDTQNGIYNGGQCIIDTSQLANSNKYVDYRNAYLTMPMVLTLVNATAPLPAGQYQPNVNKDYCAVGLKNNFASIIHSMTLDYAGVTILQQTAMCQMFQNFTLMTTLSLQDVMLNGPTIGFFPDTAASVSTGDEDSGSSGIVSNNRNSLGQAPVVVPTATAGSQTLAENGLSLGVGNAGFAKRQEGLLVGNTLMNVKNVQNGYYSMLSTAYPGLFYQIQAIIRLRDIHPFFNQVPLLKGVFFRLTLNLNQTTQTISSVPPTGTSGTDAYVAGSLQSTAQSVPLGGVSMIMIASAEKEQTNSETSDGDIVVCPNGGINLASGSTSSTYISALCVGNRPIDAQTLSIYSKLGHPSPQSNLSASVQLNVPAYTFAPSYEESYLASPSKTILYTDIYQYTTPVATGGNSFNFLITNGIANIKSVLILPFFTSSGTLVTSQKPWQSPFDPAGCGPTSPAAHISNFNVVIAGQNMIYNTQKYSYEQYLNQLQGVNSVNGNLINGLTSSLVNQNDFYQEYCYYYVDCSRGLPIDEAVPKSVMIQGENSSMNDVQYVVFIEYGIQVTVDVLTGSRI